jgi:hypothetical protein
VAVAPDAQARKSRRRAGAGTRCEYDRYCFDGAGAVGFAGVIGCVGVAAPVAEAGGADAGGVMGIGATALPVVAAGDGLLAVLFGLFQPAIRMIAIKASTAMPAIHPHMPPALSERRVTGSPSRGSFRGSVMAVLLAVQRLEPEKPAGAAAGSAKPRWNCGSEAGRAAKAVS